jgi:hypothetical protein
MRMAMAMLAMLPLAFASPVRAWGAAGHAIVGELAQSYLAPQSQLEIAKLLAPGERLADVANWADDYRKHCLNTAGWHYVNIPIAAASYDPARDCPEPKGCVISATERSLAILADPNSPSEDRALALRLVVHFIGDLHQPLHSGDRGDQGGNAVRVRFAGRSANLHSVWDYGLISWTGRSVPDYVAMLARSLTAAEARRFKRGGVREWVLQAQRVARRVYAKVPKPRANAAPSEPIELGDDYAAAALPTLDEQLLRAGVRLAAALDAAFAKPGPAASDSQLTAARACVAPLPKSNSKSK